MDLHRANVAQILQVLVFCIPFYDFLDQVGKRAAHNFKSDTPLLDAMYANFLNFLGVNMLTFLQDHVYARIQSH